jgi:acyl carrier protein
LDRKLSQTIISTRDLNERIQTLGNSLGNWHESNTRTKGESLKSKHARPKLSSEFIPPRNEIEGAIVEVWQELLGLESLGVRDNFFELGGHSLLGTQVMSRIYQLFNIQVPLRKLFDVGTVEGLAELIELANWSSSVKISAGSSQSDEREIVEI